MMNRQSAWPCIVAILVSIASVGACHHGSASNVTASAVTDSARGVVAITGTAVEQRIELRSDRGTVVIDPSGSQAPLLARLSGLEVMIRGVATGRRFQVASFLVLSADGEPVVDGTLTKRGATFAIVTAQGAKAIAMPPVAFQDLIGARIWIRGSLDRTPSSYGVIAMPAAQSAPPVRGS